MTPLSQKTTLNPSREIPLIRDNAENYPKTTMHYSFPSLYQVHLSKKRASTLPDEMRTQWEASWPRCESGLENLSSLRLP